MPFIVAQISRGLGQSPNRPLPPGTALGHEGCMSRSTASFTCTACGAVHKKWAGRCDACGAWNSVVEEAPLSAGPPSKSLGTARGRRIELSTLATEEAPPPRAPSWMEELDRVLGGGLVPASAILVGGDPGIGKSTLLLQATASFAGKGLKCLYISGEEAAAQVRMRAQRLGLADAPVLLASETNLRDILTTLDSERPDLAIIDSIQTLWADMVEAAPGSVAQVRAAAHELVSFAKKRGTAIILVGHVTKDGQIAGPRVVEHMVDCVLYFEGERGHQFRILRAVKNRFGPAGSRLSSRPRRSARRAAPSSGWTADGSRPSLPCSNPAAGFPSPDSTCSSTSPAACASPNPPPTLPSPPPSCRRARTSRCPPTWWSLAKYPSPARCARCRKLKTG